MDNFKRQYMQLPMFDENDELLYYTALIYEYNCENYDNILVLLNGYLPRIERDRVFLPPNLLRLSGKYARIEKIWVDRVINRLGKSQSDYRTYKSKVDRLSYEGLIRQYENIPQEIFDKIKELVEL